MRESRFMPTLMQLFITFFKIGLFTFGGGGVMIAWMQDELVRNRKWVNDNDFLDYYAIAQCTPGIIAVNVATLIGYDIRKRVGATLATIAVILPSVIVITLIAAILPDFLKNDTIVHAFNGIKAAVVAIIINVTIGMLRKSVKDKIGWFIFLSAFLLLVLLSPSPILMILYGCIIGVIRQKFKLLGDKK